MRLRDDETLHVAGPAVLRRDEGGGRGLQAHAHTGLVNLEPSGHFERCDFERKNSEILFQISFPDTHGRKRSRVAIPVQVALPRQVMKRSTDGRTFYDELLPRAQNKF